MLWPLDTAEHAVFLIGFLIKSSGNGLRMVHGNEMLLYKLFSEQTNVTLMLEVLWSTKALVTFVYKQDLKLGLKLLTFSFSMEK